MRSGWQALLIVLPSALGCDSADVGAHPDAGTEAGVDAGGAPDAGERDAGPGDAGSAEVLFEERFDDEDVTSRWTSNTEPNVLRFEDGVVRSPGGCDAYGPCPEGPAVIRSVATFEVPDDDRLTIDVDLRLRDNREYFESSVLVSLGRGDSAPRIETAECGAEVMRCWRGFAFFVIGQVRFPRELAVHADVFDAQMPDTELHTIEPDLVEGRIYHLRLSLCGRDGVRARVLDRERIVADEYSTRSIRPDTAEQRVYVEAQGEGHEVDNLRITAGADCLLGS